ncbi:histone H4-like TAF Taf6 [Conglomerata obtusa]
MLFSKETIKAYAASKGISQIEDNAYQIMSQDLEYRIKELCQEATKFMHASHRTKLTIDDVNYALISRNIDPLFGYDPTEVLTFKNINNYFYIPDEEIDLEEFLNKPLPKIPLKPTITSHWLAIEGVQPQIPQNPLISEKKEIINDSLQNYIEDAEIKATTKHLLTKELQLYFEKINKYVTGTDDEKQLALDCLENDSGIQQLLPYFVHSFYDTISNKKEIKDNLTVQTIICMFYSLLKNKHVFIDPYLHQIIPAVLTGVLGQNLNDETRKIAAETIKYIFEKYSEAYTSLTPRIIKTLKKNWLDKEKDENVQFGALFCLSLLGENVIEDVIEKNLEEYTEVSHNEKITALIDKTVNK